MTMRIQPSPRSRITQMQPENSKSKTNAALLAVQIMASVRPYTAFPPVSLIT